MSLPTNFHIDLEPFGSRFQPTGFPNLGAAEYKAPLNGAWVPALHVESPQSMANRLEGQTWDQGNQGQIALLEGLPYVRVESGDGSFLTSSRLEAHRLASAYVMEAMWGEETGEDALGQQFKASKTDVGMDVRHVAREVFKLDPLSLVHGVFFARKPWSWQPKVARALTVFIDAVDVQPAFSGGVKTDSVRSSQEEGGGGAEAGYGMVPHSRKEYVAQRIRAYVSVDQRQLRSYGLSEPQLEVLESLIEWELANLFAPGDLRLRTACLFTVKGDSPLPSLAHAEDRIQRAIAACAGSLGPVRTVTWNGHKGK